MLWLQHKALSCVELPLNSPHLHPSPKPTSKDLHHHKCPACSPNTVTVSKTHTYPINFPQVQYQSH